MLATIKGIVSGVAEQAITLEVGSFGLILNVPNGANYEQQQTITLYTYFHWNQENGPSLYGFSSEFEKTLFCLILGCSGIGPKIGLAVLQTMSPTDFLKAIQENDIKAISATPGIGAKKAEQIIVQLRDKAEKLIDSGLPMREENSLSNHQTLQKVLVSLNYSRGEIAQALDYVRSKKESQATFDQQVRLALSYLSKQI